MILLVLSGCAAKMVLLPHDAAIYYQQWQNELSKRNECEDDIQILKDSCDKLLPYEK